MKFIEEIRITNFRSIRKLNTKLNTNELTIFVGKNDQGKSNILRALNLFFNNLTDYEQNFRFDNNYCFNAESGKGKKREIKIELIIQPPVERFKNAEKIKWTKIWKPDGTIKETRKHLNGKELSTRNNVNQWLSKLIFRYIPAVKGEKFFSTLMGELHDVLNTTYHDKLTTQGENFITGIQEITIDISNTLKKLLKIPNLIQVPSDFKMLFSNLDFGLKKNGNIYHLKQRGDGIKIRHIPIILRYMAEQEKNLALRGYVNPDTIWGFEEPENNLEMKYAFDLAEEFLSYLGEIQIFVTTHSPAFYALDKTNDDQIYTYFVNKNSDEETEIKKIMHDEYEDIHEEMGLLPLITPYLEEINEQAKKLEYQKNRLSTLSDGIKCFILTEDSNNTYLKSFLEFHDFRMNETEIISYHGVGNIRSASLILGKHLREKYKDCTIILHRDKDYLTEADLNILKTNIEKKGIYFFTTTGTDIESTFLNIDHLHCITRIAKDDLKKMLEESIDENEENSLGRFINYSMNNLTKEQIKLSNKGDHFKLQKELREQYYANKEDYMYGKKVFGVLKSKIQQKQGENPCLIQKSEYILSEQLTSLCKKIWLNT
jgi:predicted ATPase